MTPSFRGGSSAEASAEAEAEESRSAAPPRGAGIHFLPLRAWHAAAAYAFLAAVFTWPLILRPAHWVFFGIPDTRPHLWNYWWVQRCLLAGACPLHTDLLFYPSGTSLALASVAYPYCLLSVPLQLLFPPPEGLAIGMTATIFFSFIATGLGAYLLARDLTGSRAAGFAAGIAVAFTVYRVWHLGRMNVLGIEGVVFSLWLLFRVLRGGEARARDGIALGLALAYTFYTDITYTVYLAGAAALVLVYHLAFERDRLWHRRCAGALVLGAAVALAVCAPLLWAAIAELRRNPGAAMGVQAASYFSADLAGFFLPSHLHPVWGKSLAPLYERAPQIKGYETYLGCTLLAVAVCALLGRRSLDRRLPGRRAGRRVVFWAVMAAGALVLALGPTLHWMGRETSVPLPYRLLWHALPVLRVSRTPVRLVILANVSLALLLAYAVAYLRAAPRRPVALAPALIAVIIFFENLCVPLNTNPSFVHPFYERLAGSTESYAVFEAPLLDERLKRWVMVPQTVHHRPILYADVPRRSPGADDFINANRAVFGPLLGPVPTPDGTLHLLPGDAAALKPLLVRERIRYVILHPAAVHPDLLALQYDFASQAGLQPAWQDRHLIAFRAY